MLLSHTLLAVAIAIAWGLNFVVIKIGLGDFPPLLFSALRFSLAAFPAVFFLPRPAGVGWGMLLAVGLVLGVVKFSFLFLGMHVGMSAGLASLLLQAQVFITIALVALLHHERPTRAQGLGMALGAGGLLVAATQITPAAHGLMSWPGFALTLAAAATWALANLLMRRLGRIDMLRFMVWMSLVPILPLFILSFLFEGPETVTAALTHMSWSGAAAVLYIAGVATIAAYAGWGMLLVRYPAAQVTPFALLVPVIGMVSSALLLGERFTPGHMLAAGLILSGLLVTNFADRWLR